MQLEYRNTSATTKGMIMLINTSGNTVWKKEVGIVKGKNHCAIPVTNIPAGEYYVQLALVNGKIITKQMSILK